VVSSSDVPATEAGNTMGFIYTTVRFPGGSFMIRLMRAACTLSVSMVLLSACAQNWQLTMMPRNSGKVYTGTAHGDGFGGGTVKVIIDGVSYEGPAMRTSSNDTFGFFQTYGSRGQSSFGTTESVGGSITVKAILSSPDSRGLRCDLVGDGMGHLGGICLDDRSNIYDVLASR